MDLSYKLNEDKEVRDQEGSMGVFLLTGNVIKYLSLERSNVLIQGKRRN
jgi:hypothetical protein